MPELPEVETIRRDLKKILTGRTIQTVEVQDSTVLTGFLPDGRPRRKIDPQSFQAQVVGKKISGFNRRGKYLVMEFTDRTSLIFHLRMTGRILVKEPAGNERLRIRFDSGFPLCFSDHRRFGEVVYSEDWKQAPGLKDLGIEPLNGSLTARFLQEIFKGRKAAVHALLLNQKLISGIGNIYATEALFKARIHPAHPASRISIERLESLVVSIREVLEQSIKNRGYSMSTYVDALGRSGKSQLFTSAYGKEGLPCVVCKALLRRSVLSGRSVFFCSKCQK